jgi:enamine deaminase RidA (YjgF/YER057c/UK114 family)
MSPEDKLRALGIDLGNPSPPVASYVAAVRTGNLVFLSGALPLREDGSTIDGRVGSGLTVEQGAEAARLATIGLLSRLKAETGSLDKVRRIVKLTGFVNCGPDFMQHPQVINGASDFLAEVFGEAGRHARAAVGCSSLPLGAAVEVEMVVEVS